MNSTLFWLIVGLGVVLVAAWGFVASRRSKAVAAAKRESAAAAALSMARQPAAAAPAPEPAPMPAPAPARTPAVAPAPTTASAKAAAPAAPVPGAPGGIERRSPGRLAADRVIAAELARRQAAPTPTPAVAKPALTPNPDADLEATVIINPLPAANAPKVVRLPAHTSASAAPSAAARPLAPVVPIARTAAPTPAPRLKTVEQTLVMVVDDSKMVRLKTSKLLAAQGFQIVTAVDGLDAVKQLDNCLPDLIVTDVDMPNMDGFDLTRHLRGSQRHAAMPIVMVTSAEDRHREEAMKLGVGLMLGKPYPEEQLVAHIRGFAFAHPAEQEPAEALA